MVKIKIMKICFALSAKTGKDGKPESCKPITKVEWKSVRNRYSNMMILVS